MELLIVALAGFLAAMVDGALGMGFGPTSSSILLSSTGLSPAAVSTTVNLAKVATGIAGGIAHWRFKNVDRRLVLELADPGLHRRRHRRHHPEQRRRRPAEAVPRCAPPARRHPHPVPVQPSVAAVRLPTRRWRTRAPPPHFDERGITLAAGTGGITNGLVGAWGPVVTPFLLHRGLTPRFAVGSVNTAEVAVATVSSVALISSLGKDGIDVGVALAMLCGGVLAAPLAAMVVRHIPARALGVAVAGLLLITNVRELGNWSHLGPLVWALYGVVALCVAGPRTGRSCEPGAKAGELTQLRGEPAQPVHPPSSDVV